MIFRVRLNTVEMDFEEETGAGFDPMRLQIHSSVSVSMSSQCRAILVQ